MICGEKAETVGWIVSKIKKLAQKESKPHYGNVAKFVHQKLCEKGELVCREKWHEHIREGVVENVNFKLFWDFNTQCNNVIEAGRRGHCYHKKDKQSL